MIIRNLGLQDYDITWQNMQRYTQERSGDGNDELWIVEHNPVYTLGLNGKREHLLNVGNIPVIQSDRGGQVTYHGPGQLVIYTLFDIKRLQLNIRELVSLLESSMFSTLAEPVIFANAKSDAPGVYV
jgi:lipoyl(octanoyl) transferase